MVRGPGYECPVTCFGAKCVEQYNLSRFGREYLLHSIEGIITGFHINPGGGNLSSPRSYGKIRSLGLPGVDLLVFPTKLVHGPVELK